MSAEIQIPKPYLVILALYELGGEADVETIAVKAFEMFPDYFSWKSFPEYPDKDVVRVHLSDAKKAKFGELVADQDLRFEGNRSRGRTKRFALTKHGVEKAKEIREKLADSTIRAQPTSVEYRRIIDPVIESECFKRFVEVGEINPSERDAFLRSFKLFPDASPFVINGRLARAQRIVESLDKSSTKANLLHFIAEGRRTFQV